MPDPITPIICTNLRDGKCQFEHFMEMRVELLLAKIKSLDEKMSIKFENNEKTLVDRTLALDRRLEVMNEFRQALTDREATYYTRPEHDVYSRMVETDLRMLRESRAELMGKASQSSVLLTLAVAISGMVFGAATLVLRIFGK
jgi:hypothetical protein